MKRETVHRLEVDGYTILVMERVASEVWTTNNQRCFVGSRTPVGVLFERNGKTIAVDIEGNPLDTQAVERFSRMNP